MFARISMNKVSAMVATAVFSLLAPAMAFAAPDLQDSNGIPVADGEQTARTCYLHAQGFWNKVMASNPRNHNYLNLSYKAFAGCAKVAIDTGKTLPNGQRLPWLTDYFASTVGATYAQLQLASITSAKEKCGHLSLAHDLAEQAMESETGFGEPQPQFESDWQTLTDNVKTQALSCGAKGSGA